MAWRGAPERVTVQGGASGPEERTVLELVSGTAPVGGAAVTVRVHGPDGARARVAEGSRDGEYVLFAAAEHPGEWRIRLRASVEGHEEAEAEFPLVSPPGFDLTFWRQFAFDAYDCPSASACEGDGEVESRRLLVLPETPDFYIADAGLSSAEIRTIAEQIPRTAEELTGNPFSGAIEIGGEGAPREGQVLIRILAPDDEAWETDDPPCGRARVGARAGEVQLNRNCIRASSAVFEELLAHELGHAFGFFHVSPPHVMQASGWVGRANFTPTERSHALLAQWLGRGARYSGTPLEGTFRAPQDPAAVLRAGGVVISCYR